MPLAGIEGVWLVERFMLCDHSVCRGLAVLPSPFAGQCQDGAT